MTCSYCKKQIELTTTQITTGQVICSNCKKSWQMTQLFLLQEKNLLQPPQTVQLFTRNGIPLLKIKGQLLKERQDWVLIGFLIIWLIQIFVMADSLQNIWGIITIFIPVLGALIVRYFMLLQYIFLIDKEVLEFTEISGSIKSKNKIQQSEIIELTYKIEDEFLLYRPYTEIITSKKVYKIGQQMTEEASFYCHCWLKAVVNRN